MARSQFSSYRSAHRARNHDSAHSAESPDSHARVDHALVSYAEPTLIATQPALQSLVDHLRESKLFSYDSEFIGELTYVPRLCLIQVASPTQIALIDPMAEIDLKPFWELLADGSVEKIVHAGQQDLEPVIRAIGQAPKNVFDTQIAAGFVRLPYPLSLSKLVYEMTGAKLGKGLTFTRWDQRPLSAMQLRYAADDVRYLLLARQIIGQTLEELGHMAWVQEECAAQCEPSFYESEPERQYLRVRGVGNLPPRNLGVLRELAAWRDGAARAHDVPPRALLKDEILIDLARTPVRSVDKLARVKGLPRPVEIDFGGEIVAATEQAFALAENALPLPRDTEQTPPEKFRTDALWATAQATCAGRGIDMAVVGSRQEVNDLYLQLTSIAGKPATSRLLTGWRNEALGETLKKLLVGKRQVTLSWNDGHPVSKID
jgi:ribonuclease D